jgi:uncharacterized OB-fold protein
MTDANVRFVASSSASPADGEPRAVAVTAGVIQIADDGTATLLGGRCQACAHLHFPAAPCCPYCGGDPIERVALPRQGTLWGWTAVTASPPGYGGPVPYGIGVVELGGELRLVSRLTETDTAALSFGQPVELVVDEVGVTDEGDRLVTWAFAPVEERP